MTTTATATIDRTDFLRAVTFAKRATRKDTKIPALSNLRLQTSNGALRIEGSNFDQFNGITVPATSEGEIDTTVAADALTKVLSGATDDLVVVSHDGNGGKLAIEFKPRPHRSSGASLTTLSVETFPKHDVRAPVAFTIEPARLLNTLERTIFSASKEETRYYLNGIHLSGWINAEGDRALRFSATDGHRLADIWLRKFPLPDAFHSIIIPNKAVTDIIALCKVASEPLKVAIGKLSVMVTAGSDGVYSKTIDGTYPDVSRVVRETNPIIARAYTSDARAALSVLVKVATEGNRAVKLAFAADHCKLTLRDVENGDMTGSFPCRFTGEPLTIGLNANYINSILSAIEGREVSLGFEDQGSPVNITDPADDSAQFVLMPMRV